MKNLGSVAIAIFLIHLTAYSESSQLYWAFLHDFKGMDSKWGVPTDNQLGTSFLDCIYTTASGQEKDGEIWVLKDVVRHYKTYTLYWVLAPEGKSIQDQYNLAAPTLTQAERLHRTREIPFHSTAKTNQEDASRLCEDIFMATNKEYSGISRISNASIHKYDPSNSPAGIGSFFFWNVAAPALIGTILPIWWIRRDYNQRILDW